MHRRTAYIPLSTYPEAASDDSILAAVRFAASLGCALHVTTFPINIPQMRSPLGDLFLDVPALVRANEEKSKTESLRLQSLVKTAVSAQSELDVSARTIVLGATLDAATAEARYYDLAVTPWSSETQVAQDLSQAVVFGSGRPTILVPSSARTATPDHIAIAWDGSRVAARALWDALALLPEDGQLTVLTILDEKRISAPDLARSLASSLEMRGYKTKPLHTVLSERSIAEALQDSAVEAGAQLLAMGGFGHSRVRDFILGGATKGVLDDLRLPVLLSH